MLLTTFRGPSRRAVICSISGRPSAPDDVALLDLLNPGTYCFKFNPYRANPSQRQSNRPVDMRARQPTRGIGFRLLSSSQGSLVDILIFWHFCSREERNGFNLTLKEGLTRCRPVSWPDLMSTATFLQQEERNGFNLTLKEGLTRCRPVSWPDLMLAGQLLVPLVGSEPPALRRHSNRPVGDKCWRTDSEQSLPRTLNNIRPVFLTLLHSRCRFPASLVDIFYYSGPKSIFSGEGRNDFNLKKGEKASMVIQGHSPWAQPLALRRSGNSTGSTRIIVCAPRDGHVDTFDLYPLTFSDMNQELLEGSKGGGIHRSGNTRITTNADHEPARRFLNRIFIFVALAFTNPQNADPEAEEDEMADAATYKKYREKQSVPHRIRQHLPDLNTPDGILDVLALRSYVVLFLALTSSAYPYLVKSRNDWHSHALQVKSDIWQEVHYAWTMALELDDYLLDDYKFEQVVPGTGPENFEEAADASPNTGRTYFAPEGKQPSRAMAVKLWRRFYQAVRPRRTHARHGRHDRRSKLQELALALCHIYAKAMCWVSMPAPPPSIHLQKIATSLATK
ncbi:hypothetical protein B0H13DRAFT_1897153 [Mycena leptocephala]|nr:hypothetical protein B0H13DRAFT_1897153 [Mycena leptocephala]